MANNVSATIVVQFTNSGNGILTAELDSRPEGYNQGKTSFAAGDEPVILVRKTSNVVINSVITSVGTCSPYATGQTAEEEYLNFVQSKQSQAGKVISSGFSSQWYGADLGGVRVVGEKDVVLTATEPVTGAGVLGINYNSAFIAYKLSGIPAMVNGRNNFSVLVAFIGSYT